MDEFEGTPLLFAQREGHALALACSAPWLKRSVGYVGSSDGWQDLKAHKKMIWEYTRAENGNIALTAEIDLSKSQGDFALALGFGNNPEEAARNAIASLRDGFDKAKHDYIAGWQEWTKTHASLEQSELSPGDLSQISLAVLRTHESKTAPGGLIASLSIPWGSSKGDNDLGGYHLVWSRDMVETAGALLAAGAHQDVRRVLSYLQATQQSDGHWSQNMWLDGSPYWTGIQMDETALPILLVDQAKREKALAAGDVEGFWPMVRQAAGYLVRNGPVSPQDRWEEDPGYSPFTVAAQIAALLAAADLADLNHEASIADQARAVLKRIRSPEKVESELGEIQHSVTQQKGHWSELLSPLLRPAMMVGVGLAIAQQITGINTVIYYAPTIFKFAGLSSVSGAILASVGVGVVNVVLTVVAMQLIDRVGRRPLLLVSLGGMALSLFVLGLAFSLSQFAGSLGWIAVTSLMVYVGSFAVGLGPVFWLILSEIYPLSIRGRAMSVGTVANWSANLIVALSFLTLTQVLGKPATFWLYGVVTVGAWLFAFFLVPETKGKTLEEIEAHWRAGKASTGPMKHSQSRA